MIALFCQINTNFRIIISRIKFCAKLLGVGRIIVVNHNNVDYDLNGNFDVISKHDQETILRLAGGNASIKIYTDDGDIRLSV